MESSSFDVPNIVYESEQIICDILMRFIDHIINSLRTEKFLNEVIDSIFSSIPVFCLKKY